MQRFQAIHLDEPDLIFGNRQEEKDPRLGLAHFGPFFATGESAPSPSQVRVGIVGTGETTSVAEEILRSLRGRIPSTEANRWLYPDFEGFSLDAPIRSEILTSPNWNAPLTQQEIKRIIDILDPQKRISEAANLFVNKVGHIKMEEDQPNVVVLALPRDIEEYCGISEKTRGAKKPKFTPRERRQHELKKEHQGFLEQWGFELAEDDEEDDERSYDLRNAIKGKVMRHGIPVQLLRETRARGYLTRLQYGNEKESVVPESAGYAWDLATGLYYKANGKPWRLAKLTPGTCYVGISFYRYLRSPDLDLQTSMAQVFTHSGDGFVLRGTEVRVDRWSKEAHLSEKQATSLLTDVLEKYNVKAKAPPSRIVIHKTSRFSQEERKGFLEVVQETPFDFVTINDRPPAKFFRLGEYPVLRGTLVALGNSEYLLYTGGYTPRIRTYPGRRVPQPLHVILDGCSSIELVGKEILGLTKLNWNTTSFSTRFPITLEFAYRVARVLSELEPGAPLQDHYRFYM